MRLLKQIMDKKLDNYRFLVKIPQEELAYQEHISVYLLSLCYLELSDPNLEHKISLWRRFVNTGNKSHFLKLLAFKSEEDYIILRAVKKMDLAKEEQSEKWSSLFSDFAWAILSYEHEEEI